MQPGLGKRDGLDNQDRSILSVCTHIDIDPAAPVRSRCRGKDTIGVKDRSEVKSAAQHNLFFGRRRNGSSREHLELTSFDNEASLTSYSAH